jgi:hypothetical protein
MNCKYVCDNYGVPAQIGRRVIVYGDPGISAEDRGHYIGVNFDKDKPGVITNCHPVEKVEYGDMGKIRKLTPGQRRYQAYLKCEYNLTFAQWLGIDIPKHIDRFPQNKNNAY